VCPEEHDAIMVLVPCPLLDINTHTHTQEEEEEREKELVEIVKKAVLQRFERFPNMQNFRTHIIHERIITPREWRAKYSLSRGAVFGLKHDLLQLSILRPGAKNEGGIEGLYHVGASNRPGNGVPLVMVGAKLVAEKVMKDLYG
jgi:phytoene desaturase (3,4-didehydrolycopene-forming)